MKLKLNEVPKEAIIEASNKCLLLRLRRHPYHENLYAIQTS